MVSPLAHLIIVVTMSPAFTRRVASGVSLRCSLSQASRPAAFDAMLQSVSMRFPRLRFSSLAIGPISWVG